MAKKYPGLYLYFDWMKGLEQLPCDVAMKIICNLYHYAEEEREPEPLDNMLYNILQDMYLDQIKRSKMQEEKGRKGGIARTNHSRGACAVRTAPVGGYEYVDDGEDAEEAPRDEKDYDKNMRLYDVMMSCLTETAACPAHSYDSLGG
ncbi:MAG: hypothetical protein IJX72_00705 [Clostridia bacterium]|nr:hypothetical protein [Clostridia bacterium]